MFTFKNTLILLLMPFLMLTGCSKDDENGPVTRTLLQGQWRVALFVDSGSDETSDFLGYQFTFNDNGVITAVKTGAPTVTGSFSTAGDDSQDKLFLNFGSLSQFNELNEDWRIIDKSSTRIRLEHVSGGNGGTDLLTLERL